MTTIIATRDAIYSDGMVTVDSRVDSINFKKVRKIEGYLVGGAGRLSSILTFFDWMEQKIKAERLQDELPSLVMETDPEKEDEEFVALVVHPDGEIYLHEGNDPSRAYPIDTDYYSVGSGSDYALAALDAGATPERAMDVAKFRDAYSGGATFFEVILPEDKKVELTDEVMQSMSKEDLMNLIKTGVPLGTPENIFVPASTTDPESSTGSQEPVG